MKKVIAVIMLAVMVLCMCSACNKKDTAEIKENNERLSIVATIFPEYDWVKEIVKGNDDIDLTLLLDKGVDLHSFQPTAADIVKVSECDMFIYVGGESDAWVDDALAEAVNKDMTVINLLDVLGDSVKEEELVEGMEGEEEEEDEGPEYDEHVWLSLKSTKTLCRYIADELEKKDSANSALYENNVTSYISELDALDAEYEKAVDSAKFKTLLFGDRFPFRYLVDDYGLDYYAAFVGCSAESEASFKTITFLAGKVDELGLKTVIKLENSDGRIARTIIDNTAMRDCAIVTLDAMQSVKAQDVENGATYLGIATSNLEELKKALN